MLEKQKFMAEKLQELHKNNKMFVIPNAWDVASAYIYENKDFRLLQQQAPALLIL